MRLSAENALRALETCASPISLDHEGVDSHGQWVRRRTADGDMVVLDQPQSEGGDKFVEDLIKNIVALTGIEPDFVDK